MRTRKLFTASAVLLILGLTSVWSKWNGSAGINAGDSVAAWAVSFSGSVTGWPALIGVISIIAALVAFLWAVIREAVGSSKS